MKGKDRPKRRPVLGWEMGMGLGAVGRKLPVGKAPGFPLSTQEL